MEFSGTLDKEYGSSSEFGITTEIREYLKETAKWAKFISILAFVFLGLGVIFSLGLSFFLGTALSELEGMGAGFSTTFISVFYLIIIAIMFLPVLYLYRFASKMQVALANDDQIVLNESFMNLKSHYKFYGIFMAIVMGFYLLIFLFAGGMSLIIG